MFRFTIRELLILTLSVGLGTGWWLEHRASAANAEAAQDAKFLAQVSIHGCCCQMVEEWERLREKYGVEPAFFGDPAKWDALTEERRRIRQASQQP